MGVLGLVVGFVFLGIAGLLFWRSKSAKESIYQMKLAETRSVGALRAMADEIAAEIGAGGFNEVCEVKGRLGSDEPLEGELSKQPCGWYRMRIERKWEEEVEEYDELQDKTVRRTVSGSDTLSSNTRDTLCWIDDGSGRLDLRLDGADIDSEKVVDRFEPGDTPSFGGLSIPALTGARRTIGYRYVEEILPLGRDVYCLGEVTDTEGLAMRKPSRDDQRFFISLKSEEEQLRSAEKSQKLSMVGSIACAAIGLLAICGGGATMVLNLFDY